MKSFKSFLTENIKDVVDEKYLIKELTSGKFKNNLKYVYYIAKNVQKTDLPQGLIYRGMIDSFVNTNPVTLLHYSTERVSAYTSNKYNILVSKYLPSWKDYPKRNKSFICSTDIERAGVYTEDSDPCIIVPTDDARIGICSSYDFWFSFPHIQKTLNITSMDGFNRALQIFMTNISRIFSIDISHVGTDLSEEDISEKEILSIAKFLKDITPNELKNKKIEYENDLSVEKPKLLPFDNIHKYIINNINVSKNKNIDLMQILDDLLNPHTNDFTIGDFRDSIEHENSEVWMEGPAILISNIHVFVEICDRYYKRK